MRQEQIDVALLLPNSFRTAILARLGGARERIGSVTTVAALRQTYKDLSGRKKALLFFRILDDGRVVAEVSAGAGLPRGCVDAVAAWTAAFLAEASRTSEKARAIRVRDATQMMEGELEGVGFYRAFAAASSSA
jgi:hypothetical protein